MHNYQEATVQQAVELMASIGVNDPKDLHPGLLQQSSGSNEHRKYSDLYEWLKPGELLSQPPQSWADDWQAADSGTFTRRRT